MYSVECIFTDVTKNCFLKIHQGDSDPGHSEYTLLSTEKTEKSQRQKWRRPIFTGTIPVTKDGDRERVVQTRLREYRRTIGYAVGTHLTFFLLKETLGVDRGDFSIELIVLRFLRFYYFHQGVHTCGLDTSYYPGTNDTFSLYMEGQIGSLVTYRHRYRQTVLRTQNVNYILGSNVKNS